MNEDGSERLYKTEFYKIFETYDLWKYEYSKQNIFKVKVLLQKQNFKEQKIKKLMTSTAYEFCTSLFIIVNLFCIAIKDDVLKKSDTFDKWCMIVQVLINLMFLVELILCWYAFGFKRSY